jgi:putative transcriptional regulator
LPDPNFQQTVSYICENNEAGTVGIIINRPMPVTLGEVFQQLEIEVTDKMALTKPIYFGGPVQPERGFVLHTPQRTYRSTIAVSDTIHVSTSQDILEAIAIGEGPEKSLIALGYAGWDPEQLMQEIRANSWLNCPADASILFDTPHQAQWTAAAATLGVDISSLPGDAGHA